MKIVLKDGTEIEVVEDSCTSTAIVVSCADVDAVDTITKELTDDNLSKFEYQNDDGTTVGTYENYTYVSTNYVTQDDGTYTATFTIRALSNVEIELAEIETQQTTQNASIEYTAMMTDVDLTEISEEDE